MERAVSPLGTISLANSPHIDRCDRQFKSQEESIIKDEYELGGGPQFENRKIHCEKMRQFKGLGLPTTCGYHICGQKENTSYDLVAKFGVYGSIIGLELKSCDFPRNLIDWYTCTYF